MEFRGRRICTAVQRQALSILVLSGAAVSLGTLALALAASQNARPFRYPEEKPIAG